MDHMLLDHDHSELDAELDGFFSALDKNDPAGAFAHLDVFWARLAVHIRAENLQMFPTLVQACRAPHHPDGAPAPETVDAAVARLRDDHDFFMKEITAAVKALRGFQSGGNQATASSLSDIRGRMTLVKSRLEKHNELEETEVYRWVPALLDEAGCRELTGRLQRELENLPPRLRQ